MSPDEKAIRALVDRWMSATRSGDLPAVLELMTEDVAFLVPGKEPFGKSAFAEANRARIENHVGFEGHAEPVDLQIAGDWAVMINRLRVTVSRADQTPMDSAGYTLTVLRRTDGRWRIARDANLLGPAVRSGDA